MNSQHKKIISGSKIIKGEEYDRPWKNDPTKTNKAFKLQLEENPDLYFELIRDTDLNTGEENGEWSIHFKTGNSLSPQRKNEILVVEI